MTNMVCPQCGNALNIDVLTREPRPCGQCGTVFSLDSNEKPNPDPTHQHAINRQKYFEIAAVVIMILVGFGYLALSTSKTQVANPHQVAATDVSSAVLKAGFEETDTASILGQQFTTYTRQTGILHTTIDLVTADNDPQPSVDTIVIAVSLPANRPFPPDTVIEPAVQEAFNAVVDLGETLLPVSTPGLKKAVATTATITANAVDHQKGVAQTSSGWKITYINYREYKESPEAVPLMLFVYQRLDTASHPDHADFQKALYEAINTGKEVKQVMRTHTPESR